MTFSGYHAKPALCKGVIRNADCKAISLSLNCYHSWAEIKSILYQSNLIIFKKARLQDRKILLHFKHRARQGNPKAWNPETGNRNLEPETRIRNPESVIQIL